MANEEKELADAIAWLRASAAGVETIAGGRKENTHQWFAADRLERLSAIEQERDALREALSELVDTFAPAERGPIKDPAYGDEVREIGLRIGFGALMASAEYEWRSWLAENGYPLGSEFISGPCRAVFDSDMKDARAALSQTRPDASEATDGH